MQSELAKKFTGCYRMKNRPCAKLPVMELIRTLEPRGEAEGLWEARKEGGEKRVNLEAKKNPGRKARCDANPG